MKKNLIYLLLMLSVTASVSLSAINYGKNKIQSSKIDWAKIETIHFDIYFEAEDVDFGKTAALMAEEAYYYLKEDFKKPIQQRIPIIFYKTHHDFSTTNVIYPLLNEGVGGFTEGQRNRVAVPFDGSYLKLEEVLIHELTHAYVNSLTNNRNNFIATSRLPFWFSEGLPEFESIGGSDVYNNMFIIDLIMNDGMPNLEQVGGFYAYRMGESFLNYINDAYSREKVMELFYAVRFAPNMDKASEKVFGKKFEDVQMDWKNYLKRIYFPYIVDYKMPYEAFQKLTDNRKDGSSMNFAPRFAPNGDDYLFFSNRSIHSDIWKSSQIKPEKSKRIITGEMGGLVEEFHFKRNNISWMPDGKSFAFVGKTSRGDRIYLADHKKGKILKKIAIPELEAIYEIDINSDGTKIVLSGQKKVGNDIFIYDLETEELTQITADNYFDGQPRWSPDGTKILFTSERIVNGEKAHVFYGINKNIFYYDLNEDQFYNVTDDDFNNHFPIWNSTGEIVMFVSEYGIASNFEAVELATGKRAVVTKSLGGVFSGDLNQEDEELIFSSFHNGGWNIYTLTNPLDILEFNDYQLPKEYVFEDDFYDLFPLDSYLKYGKLERKFKWERPKYPKNITKFDFRDSINVDSMAVAHNQKIDEKPEVGKEPIIYDYKAKYMIDHLWGGMAYSPSGGAYAQVQMGLSDLMGDNAIGLNLGISGEIRNSNIVATYMYLPYRLDYGVGGFYLNDDTEYRVVPITGTNYEYLREREREVGIYGILRYPFNKYWRIDMEHTLMRKESTFDWKDDYDDDWEEEYLPGGLQDSFGIVPKETENIYAPQLALVHDNSLYGSTGPVSGWKMVLLYNPNISSVKSHNVVYADIRSYRFFAKRYSFASRFIGGRVFEQESNRDFDLSYYNGVRGFDDDNLEGKNKLVTNLELRFPMIDYFRMGFPLPIALYQIRGSAFADFGLIWDDDNGFNLMEDAKLDDLKMGFGFGPRLNIGYFILKFDIAWETNLSRTSKPSYFFSLTPDF